MVTELYRLSMIGLISRTMATNGHGTLTEVQIADCELKMMRYKSHMPIVVNGRI